MSFPLRLYFSVISLFFLSVSTNSFAQAVSNSNLSQTPLQNPITWGDEESLDSRKVKELILSIKQLTEDGMNPGDYQVELIEEKLVNQGKYRSDINFTAETDLLLTSTFLKLVTDISIGRVEPKKIYADWFFQKNKIDAVQILSDALRNNKIGQTIKELFPTDVRYVQMREALKFYREISKKKIWPKVPKAGKKWEIGEMGPHIVGLRERLKASGEFSSQSDKEDYFDEELSKAVAKFQIQNGLNGDGVVGQFTLEALNISIEDRIKQIIVNMERFRWLPRDFGEKYIFANIPDYTVEFVEKNKTKLKLNTVVGQPQWRTPVFNDEMEYIVLNPQWNVPPKIARKETLPHIQKDPSYIDKMNFTVYKNEEGKRVVVDPASVDWSQANSADYLFSQKEGGANSLGRIKFMFPNEHSIYIHDTPSKYLFKRDIRAYSHGCVRLESPLELAVSILEPIKDPVWDKARLTKTIETNSYKTLTLPEKLPIYLYYLTAWVNETGQTQFRKDIYDYDQKLAKVLKL